MLALAGYNAGPNAAARWAKEESSRKLSAAEFIERIPYKETREYVANILRNKYWYQKLYPVIQEEDNIAQSQVDEN